MALRARPYPFFTVSLFAVAVAVFTGDGRTWERPVQEMTKELRGGLRRVLKPLMRPGFRMVITPTGGWLPIASSRMGGEPYAEKGDTWPVCPVCREGLGFVGQFNLLENTVVLPRALVSFFYCFECWVSGGKYIVTVKENGKDKYVFKDGVPGQWVVRFYPEAAYARAVRLEPPERMSSRATTSCRVVLEPITTAPTWDDAERYCPQAYEMLKAARHDDPSSAYRLVEAELGPREVYSKLGCYPQWIQTDATPSCIRCRKTMALLLQIDTLDETNIGWGDGACVYIFFCPDHPSELWLDIQGC